MNKYIFSINVYVDDIDMLGQCLESILDNYDIQNRVQFVIVDPKCSNKAEEICKKIKEESSESVIYLRLKNGSIAFCYNEARKCNEGKYINFTKSSAILDKGALSKVNKAFEHNMDLDAVALNPVFLDLKGARKNYLRFLDRNIIIDLEKNIYKLNFCLNSYFIKAEIVDRYTFDEEIIHDNTKLFLIKVLNRIKRYQLLKKKITCSEALELDYYNYEEQYYKTWYSDDIRKVYIPLLKECGTSRFVQSAILYLIQIKLACNMNDRHKSLLDEAELMEFLDVVGDGLAYIEDSVIAQYNIEEQRVLPRFMGMNLLRLKYKQNDLKTKVVMDQQAGSYGVSYKGTFIENYDDITLNVRAINYDGNNLTIDGEVINVYFASHEDIHVWAEVNGEHIEVERTKIYALVKFFGITVKNGYMIKFTVPVSKITNSTNIKFYLEYDGHQLNIPADFVKPQARLYLQHKASYWKFSNHKKHASRAFRKIMTYSEKKKSFRIVKSNPLKILLKEIKYMAAALVFGESFLRSVKSISLRFLYFITKPYYQNKNIWITFDQLFKGGDNGEYFYHYVSELDNHNQIIYYVANKNSTEYKQLKNKYKTVLAFNSVRHKLTSLHAKMVFTTRADAVLYCGFWFATEKYFRDLLNAEILCLQHGLTIQRIAQYQNRLFDNIKLYFCVSNYEIENISHPIYGYNQSMLTLTGAPRYDGLESKPKRQIIITPTWRRNVTAGTNKKGSMHEYSVNFKHTEYFHVYNDLINDNRLIESAQKNNYQIIYLIHPILSPQINDFKKNQYVSIIPGSAVNYEQILTESSLMLTDHSGIQFDFAYQRKPVVYYHPDRLPPQYEEGGLKYETMGFGPVIKAHDGIINELCKYMDNNCELEAEYRKRIEKFFMFDDHHNCRRVYEEAIKFQDKLNAQKGSIG